ncbi:hypothetical protein BT69DRAFT_756128 [Atractiella rhizophila]|nr:hypothetical protein BT69DRAFT_756128 [Atractiella rhizophila]
MKLTFSNQEIWESQVYSTALYGSTTLFEFIKSESLVTLYIHSGAEKIPFAEVQFHKLRSSTLRIQGGPEVKVREFFKSTGYSGTDYKFHAPGGRLFKWKSDWKGDYKVWTRLLQPMG